jgi:uracil-DNA glycosylase
MHSYDIYAVIEIMSLSRLNHQIVRCTRCPRLVAHRENVALVKVKRFADQQYWGKPVPGFGDENPKVLIIGPAPAAHGANRTGRMFTGDSSGDWLYRALYETGFANKPHSIGTGDGMILRDVYITASIRCAPPQNKPLPEEISNCRAFLHEELAIFNQVKVFLALGQIAFKNITILLDIRGLKFGHNQLYHLKDGRFLLCSYHPSRQNTQTGFLSWHEWVKIFLHVHKLIH